MNVYFLQQSSGRSCNLIFFFLKVNKIFYQLQTLFICVCFFRLSGITVATLYIYTQCILKVDNFK